MTETDDSERSLYEPPEDPKAVRQRAQLKRIEEARAALDAGPTADPRPEP